MKNILFVKFVGLLIFCSGPVITNAQSNKAESLLKQKAAAYLVGKQLDSALYFCKKLIQSYPTVENYLLMGSILEIRKEQANADTYYNKAIKISGNLSFKVYSDLAFVALKRNDTAKAISYKTRSLELHPQQPETHYFLGSIYEVKNQIDSAEYHFRMALQLDSNNTLYMKKIYALLYNRGFVIESLGILKKATNIDSTDWNAGYSLANGYIEIDEFKKAMPLLASLFKDSVPKDKDYYTLANCHLNLGDTINGILSLKRAIAIDKKENIYYDALIDIYTASGQYQSMLEVFQQASKMGLDNYTQWLDGYIADTKKMREIYKEMENGATTSQLFQLAQLYGSVKDYVNSLKLFNDYQLIGGMPSDTMFSLKAVAFMGLNRNIEAKDAILSAIQLSPDNTDYQMLLIIIYYKLKLYKDLLDLNKKQQARGMSKSYSQNQVVNYLLFKSYAALGFTNEAADYHRFLQK